MASSIDRFFHDTQQLEKRAGFCDVNLEKEARANPLILKALEPIAEQGFSYGGDTHTTSRAHTDLYKKKIFVKRDQSLNLALLGLGYELLNAKNAPRYKAIHEAYLHDNKPTNEKAHRYALAIIALESEAVFFRSKLATSLGLEDQIKNKKYLAISKKCKIEEPTADILAELQEEMVANGKVKGTEKVVDYYMQQYFDENRENNPINSNKT